jgi:hypothetical protein
VQTKNVDLQSYITLREHSNVKVIVIGSVPVDPIRMIPFWQTRSSEKQISIISIDVLDKAALKLERISARKLNQQVENLQRLATEILLLVL